MDLYLYFFFFFVVGGGVGCVGGGGGGAAHLGLEVDPDPQEILKKVMVDQRIQFSIYMS